jgi:hypothetical protein
MDTIRWKENNTRPAIKDDTADTRKNMGAGQTWHIGYLLPFLTDQSEGGSIPEKADLPCSFTPEQNWPWRTCRPRVKSD